MCYNNPINGGRRTWLWLNFLPIIVQMSSLLKNHNPCAAYALSRYQSNAKKAARSQTVFSSLVFLNPNRSKRIDSNNNDFNMLSFSSNALENLYLEFNKFGLQLATAKEFLQTIKELP